MSDTREAAHLAIEARRLAGKVYGDQRCGRASPCEVRLAVALNEMADLVTDLADTRDTSPAPATVTDEMVRLAKRKLFHESEDCDNEVRAALEAAVGPALARLAYLEKMEQRLADALLARAIPENNEVRTQCVILRSILTGSDAEKGKT